MRAQAIRWLAAFVISSAPAAAQDYPSKPVQLLVPYSAGSTTDIIARSFAETVRAAFGQPFVIVNRDGAAGTIAMAELARAANDGSTLFLGPQGILTLQLNLRKDLAYKFDQVEPICQLAESFFIIAVGAKSPYQKLSDLVADARMRKDKLNYGVPGIGAIPHLQIVMFGKAAGAEFNPVAYKNYAQMPTDLASGQLDFAIFTPGSTYGAAVRFLASLSEKRWRLMPELPTSGEFGWPANAAGFFGLYAPRGAPAAVIAKVEKLCELAAHDERFRAIAEKTGSDAAYLGRAAFKQRLDADLKEKGEAAKAAGLVPH